MLVLPAEWAGKRTIRYVDPIDETAPKQSATRLSRAPDHPAAVTLEPRAAPAGRCSSTSSRVHGADLAFGVPGESYIDVLDALRDSPIRFVTCRHEAGAANMAEAYGKLTGRPGICFVTRGPGATQASVGVHTAFQDGTPMILLVGQIRRSDVGREAFQELDYRLVFGSLAKWVAQVDRAERIPELVARAFRTATSGRPGPVVLALPEDMLVERAEVAGRVAVRPGAGVARASRARRAPAAARDGGATARDRRRSAVDGRGRQRSSGAGCEESGVPVAAAWRCQDYVDNESRCYAGHLSIGPDPALADRLRDADALLVVGARLGDIETSGFAAIPPPGVGRTLIHVHPDPNELGRVYEPTLGIVASGPRFAAALDALDPLDAERGGMRRCARRTTSRRSRARPLPGAVEMTDVMAVLRERLGPDAIVASGAGNFTVWAHRFYVFRRYRTQLAPLSRRDGVRAARPRSRRSSFTRTATSSASRVTATS